jgi:hypothetical protein
MAYNVNISPGAPPLLWSNVQEAFDQINANFEIINIVAGGALTPLDFSNLNSSVIPATTNTFQLGSDTVKWKSLYVDNYSTVPGNEYNGVWLGTSQIKGIAGIIDLPANSTVNGDLIINPDKTFFKTAQVDFNNQVVANSFSDTLNFVSGISMQLVVDSSAESITFNNTGVLSLAGTAGQIGVSAATGNITLTNLGVLSLTSTTGLPTGRTAGAGINIDNATGSGIKITNTGVLDIQNGFGITVSTDNSTGVVTITNSAPAQVTFRNYVIGGDTLDPIVADTTSDTMTINSGYGISLTKNSATDTFTISLADRIDLKGSVFGDDSSILVDAVNSYIYGNVSATTLRTAESKIALGSATAVTLQGALAIAIGQSSGQTQQGAQAIAIGQYAGNEIQGSNAIAVGYNAGYTGQEAGAVAIGYTTAQTTQRSAAVAIGWSAGQTNQGANAIAIGFRAGFTNQNASSIVLNASGAALNAAAAGFFVNPVRTADAAFYKPLMYNTATSELIYNPTLEFFNSTISTSDSSGITVDVQTTFQTDVRIENDLTVVEQLTVKGSRVINLSDIKSIVASSTSFTDFQTKIAALA